MFILPPRDFHSLHIEVIKIRQVVFYDAVRVEVENLVGNFPNEVRDQPHGDVIRVIFVVQIGAEQKLFAEQIGDVHRRKAAFGIFLFQNPV